MIDRAIRNRTPLVPEAFTALPLGAIQPQGWLRAQLRVMAEGITGHLDEVFPDVGPDCGWLGGSGDSWERAPYYLNGLIALAWTLEEEALQAKALRYIEWILQSQSEDGRFGPRGEDWWPRMVAMQALIRYYTASADARVPVFLIKALKYQYDHIDAQPLHEWATARGAENLQVVYWMYNLTGKAFLLKLAQKLVQQTIPWGGMFAMFEYTRPLSETMPWKELSAAMNSEDPDTKAKAWGQHQRTHVVNLAMALKAPMIEHMLTGGQRARTGSEQGWEKLMKHHGVAYGLFTGDEHINGASPSQGTECCAIVEAMASFEQLLLMDGKAHWGDALEKLAFNALPATLTPDGKGHQYLQQANQVRAVVGEHPWYNNMPDSNTFGLEPNFGCCTANLHQGWPFFAQSLCMAAPDGLAIASYAPCRVRARVGEGIVQLDIEGEYPFEDSVRIRVTAEGAGEFVLRLRVPEWAGDMQLQLGERAVQAPVKDGWMLLKREWQSGDCLTLRLPMEPRVTRWYHQSAAVELGPLLFAYDPGEEWTAYRDHGWLQDWEVRPKGEWRYGLFPSEGFSVTRGQAGKAFGIGEAPVRLRAQAAVVEEWGMQGDSAAPPPVAPRVPLARREEIELLPYGWTSLRIAQFPVLDGQ